MLTSASFSIQDGEGIHWLTCVRYYDDTLEVFDSLGTTGHYVRKLFHNFTGTCEFNEQQLQDSRSKTCGLFCLYFLVHRFYNIDFDLEEVLNEIFVVDTSVNEKFVESFRKNV